MKGFTQGHALLIGVGNYRDAAWRAPITAADAQCLATTLTDPAVAAYPPGQVQLLCDERASRAGVIAGLEALGRTVGIKDTVLILFCGHGALDEDGEFTFTTHDTVFSGRNVKRGTGLGKHELLGQLREIRSQKLLVLVNTCLSGQMGPTLGPPEEIGERFPDHLRAELLASGEGRAVITASRGTEPSRYRSDQPLTYFGQALIDALHGRGVPNSSGYIGLFEMYLSIYYNVKAAASDLQEPMLTILEGVGPFPVALFPKGQPTTLGEPSICKDIPVGAAVEVIKRSDIASIGRGSVAVGGNMTGGEINTGTQVTTHGTGSPIVQGDGNVVAPGLTSLINIGRHNKFGTMMIGDPVVGSVTKFSVSQGDRPPGDTVVHLVEVEHLRCAVSRLTGVPPGKSDDLDYNLSKAAQAAESNDRTRLREKLIEARRILESLEELVAGAMTLAREVGDLADRSG